MAPNQNGVGKEQARGDGDGPEDAGAHGLVGAVEEDLGDAPRKPGAEAVDAEGVVAELGDRARGVHAPAVAVRDHGEEVAVEPEIAGDACGESQTNAASAADRVG